MSPIMFEISNIQIHWYSVLMLVSILVGYFIVMKESRKYEINAFFMSNLFFWLFIFAIIGARLYYVAFKWEYYSENISEIFEIWNGGLAIHGGIIAGLLFVIIYCKKYKVKITRITDMLVVGLAIGQSIGRWGNFFNKEAFGGVVSKDFLEGLHMPDFIVDQMFIHGAYRQPAFLYESLWMFLGFVLLLIIRRRKYTKIGNVTAIYMMWYGAGRFFIETLREDSLMFNELRVAQLVSAALFFIGLIVYAITSKGSKFENLYGEKDEADIKF